MKVKTITFLIMFAGVVQVAVGDALKCYEGCGKTNIAGLKANTPCDTSKEVDCPSGQVCSTQTYSYEIDLLISKTKYEVTTEACAVKSENADDICDQLEGAVEGSPLGFTCDVKFCETALCNYGFTAHVSFLVLSAGVLVFGLL